MKKKKRSLIIVLLLVFFGIGFAFLETTLNIRGTTSVVGYTWEVKWDHIMVRSGSVSGDRVLVSPEINDDNNTTLSFSLDLHPGDYYEFTIDAINSGSMDAMVYSVDKKVGGESTIPSYLNYSVTYHDGLEIEKNQLLKANTIETYKIRVEYFMPNDYADFLEFDDETTFTFGVTYVQAEEDMQTEIPNRVYMERNSSNVFIGQPISSGSTTFNSYQAAISSFNNPIFLKHILEDGAVARSYIGFIWNNKMYYYSSEDNRAQDLEIAYAAFGEENCHTWDDLTVCLDCNTNFGTGIGSSNDGDYFKTVGYYVTETAGFGCMYGEGGWSFCGEIEYEIPEPICAN